MLTNKKKICRFNFCKICAQIETDESFPIPYHFLQFDFHRLWRWVRHKSMHLTEECFEHGTIDFELKKGQHGCKIWSNLKMNHMFFHTVYCHWSIDRTSLVFMKLRSRHWSFGFSQNKKELYDQNTFSCFNLTINLLSSQIHPRVKATSIYLIWLFEQWLLVLTSESMRFIGWSIYLRQCHRFCFAAFTIEACHDFATSTSLLCTLVLLWLVQENLDGDGWNIAVMNVANVCTATAKTRELHVTLNTNECRHFASIFVFWLNRIREFGWWTVTWDFKQLICVYQTKSMDTHKWK